MASCSIEAKGSADTDDLNQALQRLSNEKPIVEISTNNFYLRFLRHSKRHPGYDIAYFNFQTCLGKGCYGAVYFAEKTWGLNYQTRVVTVKNKAQVIKVFDLTNPRAASVISDASSAIIRRMNCEAITREFQTASVAGYLGVKPPVFTQDTAYLVMKRLPGVALLSWAQEPVCPVSLKPLPAMIDRFDEVTKLRLTYQLMLAFKRQIRDNGLIHRDIKLENILVSMGTKFSVFIVDFGFARFASLGDETYPGSVAYAAPEILDGIGSYYKSDVFSLGRLISVIWLKDFSYFMHDDIKEQLKLTRNAAQYLDIFEFDGSLAIKEMLAGMLRIDRGKRFSINQALLHFARHFPEVDDATQVAADIVKKRKLHRQERQQRCAASSSQTLVMTTEMNIQMRTIYSPPEKSADRPRGSDNQDRKLNYAIAYLLLVVCLGLLVQALYNRYSFFSPTTDSAADDFVADIPFTP